MSATCAEGEGMGKRKCRLTEFFLKIGLTIVHFHAFLRVFKSLKESADNKGKRATAVRV